MSIHPVPNFEYFMQSNVCRLCWSKNAFTPLSLNDSSLKTSKNETDIAKKISDCLQIDLSVSDNPNTICDVCYIQIAKFYDFKQFCRESDRKLREIIKVEFEKQNQTDKGKLEQIDLANNIPIENSSEVKEDVISKISISDFIEQSEELVFECSLSSPADSTKNSFDLADENSITSIPKEIEHNDSISTFSKKAKRVYIQKKRSPTYCNICCLDLHDIEKLEMHNAQEHGVENGTYKCFGCEKRFRNGKLRRGHEINFCKGLKNGYKCAICENYLPSRRKFEEHRRNHRNNVVKDIPKDIFKCTHCDKFFKNRDILKKHLSDIGRKRYVCETCGRIFDRQDYFSIHMRGHTGVRPYACTYCDFRSVQKTSLNTHIRKHTGERPYKCDMCPKRCVTSSNLSMHKKVHFKRKQYECLQCQRKYGYQKSLEDHIARVHEPPSHVCDCGAAYARSEDLRKHQATKHDSKIPEKLDSDT